MWVKITYREGENFVGALDNWPIYVYLRPDETVRFHADDIIDYVLFDEYGEQDDGVEAA